MKILSTIFLILVFICGLRAQTVRVHKTSYNFNSAIGKLGSNVSVPANVWTDVYALALIPSEQGGQWDLDAKIQIESSLINLLQNCTTQLLIRDPQNALVETIDEGADSKGAILTLKNYTSIYLGGRYTHSASTPMNVVLRVNCTTAQTVTPNGTWVRAEYKK